MKNTTRLSALLMVLWVLLWSFSATALVLHVSSGGNDEWSGLLATANAGKTDGPLASLAGARDTIRKLKSEGRAVGQVTVEIQGGGYLHAEALELTAEDSGTEEAPIVYRAAPGAAVVISGGRPVGNWERVRDAAVLARLPEVARSQVLVADLKVQGISDYGKLAVRGFAMGSGPAEAELVYDDEPMMLARWPNEGFRGVKDREDLQTVVVDTDRLSRWVAETDPWIFAYWHHDWAELYEPMVGINAASNTILRSKDIKPNYGLTPSRARWFGLNLLSEIDQPGEYYIDRSSGLLYFWPPNASGKAILTICGDLVVGREVSHVAFRGLTFEACRASAVRFSGGANCALVGCTVRHTGKRGVEFAGGTKHAVYGCDIYHTGEGGVLMKGGDRKTLTPAGHNAENNHVHHYARRARTYHPAIDVSGVGSRIAHNLVHDGPHMALRASGNDHLVEYNEIHNVVEESGDAGAYYVGRDWTQRGNVLRYNYWHQIVGATGHGGMTIYLDDQHCGHKIHGNLFERCSQAVFIGGGDDNMVTNNVFLDCWRAAHLDNRGMGWQKAATDDPNGTLRTRLRAMPYQNELWRGRYPELVDVMDDQPNVPKRNVFARNISVGGVWDHITASIKQHQTIEKNLVFDDAPVWATLVKDSAGRPKEIVFKDPAAVEKIGFKPLPLDKMGLYQDERRASWPVQHNVRPVKLP